MRSRLNAVRQKSVLIAEDDDTIAGVMKSALDDEGFRTQRVADGVAALNTILETRPDIILLDLTLPRLEGYNICAMIRKTDSVHNTPIVVISGRCSLEERLRAFEVGADDYVTKPFEIVELLARVEAVVMRYRHKYHPPPFFSQDIE